MDSKVTFGIDLGTTNSCISMLQTNATIPIVIPLRNSNTLQSCVMLSEDGEFIVGKDAYENRFKDCSIYSVKRYMGSDKVIHLTNRDKAVSLKPEQVSAEILKELVKQAEEYVGNGIIKDVTITVPAHFNDAQRRATKSAGELAGLNVVGIINEPTSAGLLYGLDNAKSNQTVLVYDLGGGTFDVSILRITKELRKFPLLGLNMSGEYNKTAINIIGNDGDVHLGGDDIDSYVTEYVICDIALQASLSVDRVKEIIGTYGIEELKLRLEKLKKSGSGIIIYELNGYGKYTVKLSGDKFEEKCYKPVFDRTYDLISSAMSSANVSVIDHIVLVGGSTKSSIIQKMLSEKFPHLSIMNTFEPDLSVALGASISSATTMGVSRIATITDVVPMSIGVMAETSDGRFGYNKILRKDSQLPCVAEKEYDIVDTSQSIMIDIRQGESTSDLSSLVQIGNLTIESEHYDGNTLIIRFKCDLNGVLSCFVIIDGKEVPVAIKYSANIISSSNKAKGYDDLTKGEKFFYDKHRQKLISMNANEDILSSWTPDVVKNNIAGAKIVFESLISKLYESDQ